jgi:NTE family protein
MPVASGVLEVIMGLSPIPGRAAPRTALVLGAGGVLGAAWIAGALPSVQELLPCSVNDVDIVMGTSAGSVVAAALRCGVGVDELIAHQRGQADQVLAHRGVADDPDAGPYPPLPRLRVGSPRLMLSTLLAPHRVHPWVGASAWLPHGRGRHDGLRDMVHALHAHAHRHVAPDGSPPAWVDRQTWIVAVDYDSGRRVIFGRPGAPPARLPDAVVASCSIPGWFEPAVVGGRRYVDGGVRSATSLGTLATAGVDQVFVLAPMASTLPDRPRMPHERLERRLRWLITRGLLREAQALRSLGVAVTVLTPGQEDLAVMGVNMMDPRRRSKVLETSLRTSATALASQSQSQQRAA